MRLRPAIGSVVGEVSETGWSQILTTPQAYAVIEVADEDGVARNHGVRIMAKLSHALETPPLSLKDVERIVSEVTDEGTVSLIVLVPVGKVVYIALAGAGLVCMKRGGMFATLLSQKGGVSGEVRVGDTIVCASDSITKSLSRDDLANSFDHLPAVEAAEKLTLLLHRKAELRSGAALIFQVAEFIEEEEIVTEPDEDDAVVRSVPVVRQSVLIRIGNRVRARRIPTVAGITRRVKLFFSDRKNLRLVAVIGFGLLFAISVLLGQARLSSDTSVRELESVYTEAKAGLDEGQALAELNPVKSRERLKSALESLAPYKDMIGTRSKEGQRLTEIKQELENAYQSVFKRYEIEPEIFYDVSLLKKDAKALSFGLFDSTLAVLDTNGSTVYAVDIQSKRGEIIGGGSTIKNATSVAAGPADAFVFSGNGIYRAPFDGVQSKTPVIDADPEWGNISALFSYGENLYLLDTDKSRIWKYTPVSKGFSERKEYLNPDTLPDFRGATGMAIDGSVWIGGMNGDIRKFTSGKDATLVLSGIDPPLSGATYVYTDDETANIYAADVPNKRIVVLTKEGVYQSQYVWAADLPVSRFVVSEKAGLALILSQGMIYSVSLK